MISKSVHNVPKSKLKSSEECSKKVYYKAPIKYTRKFQIYLKIPKCVLKWRKSVVKYKKLN